MGTVKKPYVIRGAAIAPLDLTGKQVGGVSLQGDVDLRVLLTAQRLQLVELRIGAGYYHPRHHHPEHESIGYVVSGRLQMGIGDDEYVLEPGDAWHHPVGLHHWTRALEDTLAIEIHGPPRPEFSGEMAS